MWCFLLFFMALVLLQRATCEPKVSLKIIKCTGDYFTPVSSVVEEKSGANFSLLCDLVSSEIDSNYYDFHISWIKQTQQHHNRRQNRSSSSNDVRFWREHDFVDLDSKKRRVYSILSPSEMNKAIKNFEPLRPEDKGKYICVSLKYDLYEVVEVVVRDAKPYYEDLVPIQDTIFCSEQMFQCNNGVCIIHHYICDGKADCKDGSDESWETCHGEPCKDKIHCDDGRCIPTSWCCDRYHDPNCTVTNRPKCCQVLSEPYEELESSTVIQNHNGARYIFISVCILSIMFVIALLLLILSKVVIFAKKGGLQQPSNTVTFETITLSNSALLRGCRPTFSSSTCVVYPVTGHGGPPHNSAATDECDVADPLLYSEDFAGAGEAGGGGSGREEQPPPYCALNLNEPPPPYTSREILNDEGGTGQRD